MESSGLINILLDLICSEDNIKIQNEGTLFECNYPILVVDILTKNNVYVDLKELKSLDEIKIIHIKNQETNETLSLNINDFISIKKEHHLLSIKYKKDGQENIFGIKY